MARCAAGLSRVVLAARWTWGPIAGHRSDARARLEGLELRGHPIRTFNPRGPLSVGSVVLAGDAAGVDPLLGEGISFALGYGEVAAGAIGAGFAQGRFDRAFVPADVDHPVLRA